MNVSDSNHNYKLLHSPSAAPDLYHVNPATCHMPAIECCKQGCEGHTLQPSVADAALLEGGLLYVTGFAACCENAQVAQCVFLVHQVKNCQSPIFVIFY